MPKTSSSIFFIVYFWAAAAAAQGLQIIGNGPQGPICAGPLGPGPCAAVQQWIMTHPAPTPMVGPLPPPVVAPLPPPAILPPAMLPPPPVVPAQIAPGGPGITPIRPGASPQEIAVA